MSSKPPREGARWGNAAEKGPTPPEHRQPTNSNISETVFPEDEIIRRHFRANKAHLYLENSFNEDDFVQSFRDSINLMAPYVRMDNEKVDIRFTLSNDLVKISKFYNVVISDFQNSHFAEIGELEFIRTSISFIRAVEINSKISKKLHSSSSPPFFEEQQEEDFLTVLDLLFNAQKPLFMRVLDSHESFPAYAAVDRYSMWKPALKARFISKIYFDESDFLEQIEEKNIEIKRLSKILMSRRLEEIRKKRGKYV